MIKRAVFIGLLLGVGNLNSAYAAGFALIEQSASGFGNAYAGMAARGDDASTQFFNPANLSLLPVGRQMVLGLSLVKPSAKLDDARASQQGTPIPGNGGGDAGVLAMVPNFYYADDLGNKLKFGLGVTVPYGLSSEYNKGWVGRYHALDSELMTLNINPAISWQATETLALGGGINLQYVKARLSNAIDSSALCMRSPLAGACPGAGLGQIGNAAADSYVKLEGDDLSWGFNLGLVYKPTEGTTLGAAYRSHIKHELKGEADFRRSPQINQLPQLAGRLTDGDITAGLSLPETVSLSLAQRVTDKLELLADVTWTNWSRFKELRVKFDNVGQADNVTTTSWNDSYRYSLGGNYRYSDDVTLRLGVALDQSAVPDAQHRTPRIPDADRVWFAAGASWKLDAYNTIDFGYAYLRMKDAKINHSTEGQVNHQLQGEFSPKVDIISVQWVRAL